MHLLRVSLQYTTHAGHLSSMVFDVSGMQLPYTLRVGMLAWVGMIGDSLYDPIKPGHVIRSFIHELTVDAQACIKKYGDLGNLLLKSLQQDSNELLNSSQLFAMFRKTPIFREFHLFTKDRDPALLTYIFSFCTFLKKLEIRSNREDLEANAFRKWLEVERRLQRLELPEWVSNLRSVLSKTAGTWDYSSNEYEIPFWPKHGPGAVADKNVGNDIWKKCRMLEEGIPAKLAYVTRGLTGLPHSPWPYDSSTTNSVLPSAKLIFVPKNIDELRAICPEPTVMQYAQQGIRMWIQEQMAQDSHFGPLIHIEDQSWNRDLARYGSLTSYYDTIDLSAASDSNSWALMEAIMPPNVLKWLLATRSTHVTIGNVVTMEVRKFAPMGSALCFPVQSLLYASVMLMLAYSRVTQQNWERKWSIPFDPDVMLWRPLKYADGYTGRRPLQPLVYGDDLIVDHTMTSSLISALTSIGFQVNTAKSFTGTDAVRESCGGFYLSGSDFDPFRLRLKDPETEDPISSLGSAIDAVNRAFEYGYMHVRRVLLAYVLHADFWGVRGRSIDGRNEILFVPPEDKETSFAIRAYNPTTGSLRVSSSAGLPTELAGYQRCYVRSIGVLDRGHEEQVTTVGEDGDHQRYVYADDDWYHYQSTLSNSSRREEATIKPRWVDQANLYPFTGIRHAKLPDRYDLDAGVSTPASRGERRASRLGWRWTPIQRNGAM